MIGAFAYMPVFIGLFWKSGVVLGAALCINRLFRVKSADLRRVVLSTAVVALLLSAAVAPALPQWTAVMPRLRFQQPSHASPSFKPVRETPRPGEPALLAYDSSEFLSGPGSGHPGFTLWLLPLLWSAGAITLLLRFSRSLHGLRRLRASSMPVIDSGVLVAAARHRSPARLLQSERIAAPVTWGIFRPVILVPTGFEALSPECREAVLCHELAHIETADFLMRSLAEFARAALWFQPLMWITRRQLHEEQELASDNRVLASGGRASAYAKLLLDWDARPGMDYLVAVGMANRSCLKRRLYALLDPDLHRQPAPRAGVAAAWILALAAGLPLAALNVSQVDAPEVARTPAVRPAPQPVAPPLPADIAVAGDWTGVVALPQSTLHFVLHVAGRNNALRATVDSPDQGTTGGTVESIVLSGPTLTFAIPYLDVKFSGDVNSNGTIVGTFVQRGTGVPLILARTATPSAPPGISFRPALPVTGGVFHHDRSDIEFTLPSGWSVQQMETASNDPGEMAVLADADHRTLFVSVWMRKIETHPADIPKLLDAALTRKLASREGKTGAIDEQVVDGFKIRSGSVEHTIINGRQALRAIGEYQESGRSINELLVWIYGENARAYLLLRAESSAMEALQPAFEQLIQSVRIP
jgi:Zn-dependent protease with chaperone function